MWAVSALTVIVSENPSLWDRLLLAIEQGAPADSLDASTAHAASRHGRTDEFEPFFRLHEREISAYLWRMTGDEHAAYDLAQETFLRAWQHFTRIRGYERPGGWLFRVATHLALNHLRDRSVRHGDAVSSGVESVSQHPLERSEGRMDDIATHVAEADMVRRALMAVPPRQRAALILREVYGFPCGQVAAALGMSVGGVKTLLWRARGEFRDRYAEEDC
jgi:RNA polymerase sigma-70 factor (ECF subfamily)